MTTLERPRSTPPGRPGRKPPKQRQPRLYAPGSTPNRLRGWVITILIAVPRSALAYPAYIFSSLVTIDYRRTSPGAYLRLVTLVVLSGIGLLFSAIYGNITPVGWFLEIALMFPFLLFVTGFETIWNWTTALYTIRLINAVFLVLSAVSVLKSGFPHKIPYINEHPDVFSALYGPGGARSVTVMGFFGLLGEMMASRRREATRLTTLIAVFNFLAPSYVIGIGCGLLAIGVTQAKSIKRILLLAIAAVPSIYYALFRLSALNHVFQYSTGYSPKSVPFILPGRVFGAFPLLSVLGLGAGQFTSTPQSWEDPGLRAVALHGVPHIPGLSSSSYEVQYFFDPFTSVALAHHNALSSAASKPYNGLETLITEWGLLGVIILIMFIRQVITISRHDSLIWAAAVFFLALNLTDLWIDSVWVGLGMLLTKALATADRSGVEIVERWTGRPTAPPKWRGPRTARGPAVVARFVPDEATGATG